VNPNGPHWLDEIATGQLGPLRRACLVLFFCGAAALVVLPVVWQFGAWPAVESLVLAATACGVSTAVGGVCAHWFACRGMHLHGLTIGMLVRTGPPLALAVWVDRAALAPSPASFVYLVVLFYLLTLAVDVGLNLSAITIRAQRDSQPASDSQ